jgi:hypothetical protein
MSVQGVSRVAACWCNVVLFSVVLGGAVGPAVQGSAQPLSLEPGQWYRVTPSVDEAAANPAAASERTITTAPVPQIEARNNQTDSTGMTAWLAVAGLLLIPAAGLFRHALLGSRSSIGGELVAPPFSPRGANKNV